MTISRTDKLQETFAQSAIQTLGDLIDQHKLEGYDKVPADIRAFDMSPLNRQILPENFYARLLDAHIPQARVNTLFEAIIKERARIIRIARGDEPKPPSMS